MKRLTQVKLADCGKSPAGELLAGLAHALGSAGEADPASGDACAFVFAEQDSAGHVRWVTAGQLPAAWPQSSSPEGSAAALTSRGVNEFVRYGLQQRNGLAFVAVPLDRVQVVDQPDVRLAARIEDWVSWIPRGKASRAMGAALRQFDAAHLRYARDGGALPLRDLLAAMTSLEQTVGRSERARDHIPVRKAPGAAEFLRVLADEQCAELRIAVGLASCATRLGHARLSSRTMRQILLPLDPGDPTDRAHRDGRWRDAAVPAWRWTGAASGRYGPLRPDPGR